MTPNEWAKYFRYLASKENEKGEATITVCASLASAADQVEKMSAEIEQLKEALAVSRHETGTVDNALYKYEVLWSACKGWREFDWPEGFSRRTADLIVENAERVLASTGRKEPELTKDTDYKGADRSEVAPGDQRTPSKGAHPDAEPGAQCEHIWLTGEDFDYCKYCLINKNRILYSDMEQGDG